MKIPALVLLLSKAQTIVLRIKELLHIATIRCLNSGIRNTIR